MPANWSSVKSDPLEIVSVREDGLGGVVRIPLSAEMDVVQKELITRGGGQGADAEIFTDRFFRSIVANFSRYNRPVPAYFGHISAAERKKTSAAAFVLAVSYEDGQLWGVVDLNREAWQKIVVERGFRAWSIEADENLALPEGALSGWTMTGGAITNTPGAPVAYAAELAAEQSTDAGSPRRLARWSVNLEIPQGKEEPMPEKPNTDQNKVVADLQAENSKLQAELKAEREKNAKLAVTVENKGTEELTTLKADLADLQKKNAEQARAILARDVRETISGAIEAGKLNPSQVEGWDKDPAAWLEKSPFNGLDGLRAFCERAPVVTKMQQSTSSGRPAENAGSPKEKLMVEARKIAAERKCPFLDALQVVRGTNPALYDEGIAGYNAVEG